MPESFLNKLKKKWDEGKFVCGGLDSDYSLLPASFKSDSVEDSVFNFNKSIIEATADLVCAFKVNSAFYESHGVPGLHAIIKTIHFIRDTHPDIPVILDAKRGDIGNTNQGYVKMAFEILKADAITMHPYLGKEALEPFLNEKDKGIIVLVKTSNPGSEEFQNLEVDSIPLYQIVAENVAKNWNTNGNCAVVVGATYPEELKKVREIVGDMPILVPGIGAQGGNLEAVIKNGLDSNKQGLIINSSRGIIYSENPRQATEDLDQKIRSLI